MWRDMQKCILFNKGHKVTLPHSSLAAEPVRTFTGSFQLGKCPRSCTCYVRRCLCVSRWAASRWILHLVERNGFSVCSRIILSVDLSVITAGLAVKMLRHQINGISEGQSRSKCTRLGVRPVGCMWKNKSACSYTAASPAVTLHIAHTVWSAKMETHLSLNTSIALAKCFPLVYVHDLTSLKQAWVLSDLIKSLRTNICENKTCFPMSDVQHNIHNIHSLCQFVDY